MTMPLINTEAPELEPAMWMNSANPLSLKALRGHVIAIHAFQMLCPGCVSHGIPQALKMNALFAEHGLVTLGLHTVFEHHDVITPEALKVFLHEYKIPFPVAVDRASRSGPIPITMQNYGLQGTPSLVLIDRNGLIRLNHFGRLDDMLVGKFIGQIASEEQPNTIPNQLSKNKDSQVADKAACDLHKCEINN